MKNFKVLPFAGFLALLVGCASGPGMKTAGLDPNASEAQKIYLDGMVTITDNKISTEKCQPDLASKERSWKSLVRAANACVKNQNWKGVEQIAQELSRVEINSPWSAYYYSLAAEKTGDFPRAIWMLDLALKKAPAGGLFHYQKGRVLWQLKNYKDAVGEMKLAVGTDMKLTEAHVFLAQAYFRDMNLDRAVTHYEAALSSDSHQLGCLRGLADVRMAQGKFDKAIPLLSQAIAQQNDIGLRLKLAQASEQVDGQLETALSNYRAIRDLMRSGKGSAVGIDINEKIKSLEAKLNPAKTDQKQAKLEGTPRIPASDKGVQPSKKGGGK